MVRLGEIDLGAVPVLLAPMSGVTDAPFRRMVRKFGAGLVSSEMIASQAMIREVQKTRKIARLERSEAPAAVQLAGYEPQVMAEAARLNRELGADLIDINFGCPVKKVVNGNAGSALMRDEIQAGKILEACVRAVEIPVTVKMRLGWDDGSRNAPNIARIAQQSGIRMITVHGRTRSQFYRGRADWKFIAQVKQSVDIPVIANGDLTTLDEVTLCLEQSRADGVMIGRGCYGKPWFLSQVIAWLEDGRRLPAPDLEQRHALAIEHLDDVLSHHGQDTGVRLFRKHLGWYSKGLPQAASWRDHINRLDDPKAIRQSIGILYRSFMDGAEG